MIFSLLVMFFIETFGFTFFSKVIVDFTSSLFTVIFCLSTITFFEPPHELREINKIKKVMGCHNLKLAFFFFEAEDSWV